MNPSELNALRARFPELRGMGAAQVAAWCWADLERA